MKFGVREICDVVLKAKATTTIGNKVFYKNEPVIYFDSLKTSSMEGAATTVYAQGGKGNARLVAWEGERTVTFTMEDALISPAGFMILSGAGLVEANGTAGSMGALALAAEDIKFTIGALVITGDDTTGTRSVRILSKKAIQNPFKIVLRNGSHGTFVIESKLPTSFSLGTDLTDLEKTAGYVSVINGNVNGDDDILTECFGVTADDTTKDYVPAVDAITITTLIPGSGQTLKVHTTEQLEVSADGGIYLSKKPYTNGSDNLIYVMVLDDKGEISTEPYLYTYTENDYDADHGHLIRLKGTPYVADANRPSAGQIVLVDYYVERASGAQQIEITADKFGGNYYLEASTLFRNTNGDDMAAEFIIPNCKIQSNFTFTMASSGDPSTFTFTMDAFPDYTRFDRTKKVLAAIQIIEDDAGVDEERKSTNHSHWETL